MDTVHIPFRFSYGIRGFHQFKELPKLADSVAVGGSTLGNNKRAKLEGFF